MRKTHIALASLLAMSASALLAQASAKQAAGLTKPSPQAPSEIVAAAPQADWTRIPASDLLVMDLAPGAKGQPRRVVIQLMPPPFSQGWIGNIRLLAKAHWWDGLSINRVQDNYVVQWGDADGEDPKTAKALPKGLAVVPESEYVTKYRREMFSTFGGDGGFRRVTEALTPTAVEPGQAPVALKDPYADSFAFAGGFPLALNWWIRLPFGAPPETGPENVWPVHCYGMVGVGRDLSPNTGSGAELYVVIGHAPRHLDRNIALVGRVIEGIEHLSSLPRGKGPLGFYDLAQGDERVPIVSIRLASELPTDKPFPTFEYLSTESPSFAAYADARANRRDAFFIRPAGGADICNIPVPVRRVVVK